MANIRTPQVTLSPDMTLAQVLGLYTQGRITAEDYALWDKARVKAIASRATAAAKAANGNGSGNAVSCRVGAKGNLVIRGFGQWPLNLYPEQLYRLLGAVAQLDEFTQKHLAEPWEGEVREKQNGPVVKVSRMLKTRDGGGLRASLAIQRKTAIEACRDWSADQVLSSPCPPISPSR